jgi:hypothetical protein
MVQTAPATYISSPALTRGFEANADDMIPA